MSWTLDCNAVTASDSLNIVKLTSECSQKELWWNDRSIWEYPQIRRRPSRFRSEKRLLLITDKLSVSLSVIICLTAFFCCKKHKLPIVEWGGGFLRNKLNIVPHLLTAWRDFKRETIEQEVFVQTLDSLTVTKLKKLAIFRKHVIICIESYCGLATSWFSARSGLRVGNELKIHGRSVHFVTKLGSETEPDSMCVYFRGNKLKYLDNKGVLINPHNILSSIHVVHSVARTCNVLQHDAATTNWDLSMRTWHFLFLQSVLDTLIIQHRVQAAHPGLSDGVIGRLGTSRMLEYFTNNTKNDKHHRLMRTAEQHVPAAARFKTHREPNHIKDSPIQWSVFHAMHFLAAHWCRGVSVHNVNFRCSTQVASDFAGDAKRTVHAYSKDLN